MASKRENIARRERMKEMMKGKKKGKKDSKKDGKKKSGMDYEE